ncbi:hypothetical protein OSTOST_19390, partial [Ostertagia ostertagi]
VRELHASTASDLDKQLTEFTRCAAMMKKAIRHAEFKNNELRTKMAKEKDEVLEEVITKYEALSTTQIETDKQLSEKTRLVQRLQDDLNQLRDRNEEMESAFARICNMTELSSVPQRLRTRSESPCKMLSCTRSFAPICTLLTIHCAGSAQRSLRKSAEVRDATSRVEQAEMEVNRLKKQIDLHDKEKKSLKDVEKRKEAEAAERELKMSEMSHEVRRLTDRLQAAEEEKAMKETMLSTNAGYSRNYSQ